MLRTLLESQARPARRTGGTAISVGVHTAIIGLAIVATARASSAPKDAHAEEPPVIYTRPPDPPPMPTDGRSGSGRSPVVRPIHPVIIAPFHVPDQQPRIDLGNPLPDEHVFDGRGGSFGDPLAPAGGLASPNDGVYSVASVEKAAMPRPGNPAPEYPGALRSASLEGSVVARFVIDTTGRAESQSISFPQSTHPLFAEAVRQALLRSRYLPALIGDRPVRQLVEQRFAFTLSR